MQNFNMFNYFPVGLSFISMQPPAVGGCRTLSESIPDCYTDIDVARETSLRMMQGKCLQQYVSSRDFGAFFFLTWPTVCPSTLSPCRTTELDGCLQQREMGEAFQSLLASMLFLCSCDD